jgi:hypothetical protein
MRLSFVVAISCACLLRKIQRSDRDGCCQSWEDIVDNAVRIISIKNNKILGKCIQSKGELK